MSSSSNSSSSMVIVSGTNCLSSLLLLGVWFEMALIKNESLSEMLTAEDPSYTPMMQATSTMVQFLGLFFLTELNDF
ncbi:unnamed protein product [Lasius platythorax]|uniref:Uncharacterized protein n=1 Tax=Lasius platythorax TaxID=488582 RepID=A0AAV2NRS5_9HYME